jgi:hypothetical protein
MANAAIKDHKGYIKVEEDGEVRLYLEFVPIHIINSPGSFATGYVTSFKYSPTNEIDSSGDALKLVDVLKYYTDNDSLFIDARNEIYLKCVSLPLASQRDDNTYIIAIMSPPMGSSEPTARLAVTSVTKLQDDTQNPLASYDKSVILVAIENAKTAMGDLTERQQTVLNTAIAQAQTAYSENPTEGSVILNAVAELKAAVASLAKIELNAAIAEATQLSQGNRTAESWAAFTDALTAAQAVAENPAATQSDIDVALAALQSARESLAEAVANVDKSALTALIGEAVAIANIGYSDATWTALQAAVVNAQTFAGSANPAVATQEAVNNARAALQSAIDGLVRVIDTGGLDAALAEAKAISAAGYEEKSFAALTAAIAAAEAAKAGALTDADVAKQTALVETAVAALVKPADLRVPLANGTYSLANKTALWNYSQNQASMGNPAIDHSRSFLEVKDGNARVHLFFRAMTFANMTGHLLEMSNITNANIVDGILDSYTLVPATYHSTLSETDQFLPANRTYPEEISIAVTPGERYTPVFVNVPVMGASANQPARVKIDGSGFDLGTPVDAAALNAAIAEGKAAQSGAYTAASRDALAKSVEASEVLLALNATQGMVDARAAAILAAKAALLTLSVDKTALNAAISSAEAVLNAGRGNKTADSWNAFANALNAAKTAAADAGATQGTVDAALTALTAARNGFKDEEPIAIKLPESSVRIEMPVPVVKESEDSGNGRVKTVENTVSVEAVAEIAKQATAVASEAKAGATAKIAAGETVVAEIRIVTALPTRINASEVKETVTNVSASAIKAILAESAKAGNESVELVLTVESGFASVTLDGAELAKLVTATGAGDVETVSVTVVADARNADVPLSDAQANKVPADKVPFAIEIAVDDVRVTDALASEIAITIPHAAPAEGKKLVVYYVATNGETTRHEAVYNDGKLTFTTKQI